MDKIKISVQLKHTTAVKKRIKGYVHIGQKEKPIGNLTNKIPERVKANEAMVFFN